MTAGATAMKRGLVIVGLVSAASWCAGCSVQQEARKLVAKAERGVLAMSFYPSGKSMVDQKKITAHEKIKVADGAEIDVWVIGARDAKGAPVKAKATMLILHSRHEHKASLPYFGAGKQLARKGYDVVLPDLRGHGRSTGEYITYGAKEKTDLKTVMDTLIGKKLVNPSIYVFGVNLSGSIAIQYAAIDPRCKGVMAVAPYQDFRAISRYWHLMMPAKKFEQVAAAAAKLAKFDLADTSAVVAAGKLRCPLVIYHGLLDASAPRAHAKAIFEAAKEPKKFIVPLPGERVLTLGFLEHWVAGQMDDLATKGVVGKGKDEMKTEKKEEKEEKEEKEK